MTESQGSRVTRRAFVRTAMAAGGALAFAGGMPRQTRAAEVSRPKPGTVVLFQGDSITDAGRDRKSGDPNSSSGLGRGYPCLLGGALLADYPEAQLSVYNRGISGNKVSDLAARWQEDTIALKPGILSILIGVNDIWHKLAGRYNGTVEDYENGYRALLKQTRTELPDTRVIVCEPFVLRCGAVNESWFPEFDQRRAVAKKLAGEFGLTFVPFQWMFDEAVKCAKPEYWAADGVHPTLAGHSLMAATWREVVGI